MCRRYKAVGKYFASGNSAEWKMVFIAKKFNLDLKAESNFTVTSVENGLGR